jgi:dUTP pyrophosphatase
MIGIHRRYSDVRFPLRATEQSVGYDIYAYSKTETGRPNKLLIPPRTSRAIPTGLVVIPPPGFSIFVASRSGLAKERALFVTNSPGIIDPDYRGELMVLLYNGGHEAQYVQHDDRVGQIILLPFQPFEITELSTVDETERGERGFGSTGR